MGNISERFTASYIYVHLGTVYLFSSMRTWASSSANVRVEKLTVRNIRYFAWS